jgi:hypothetical protein
MREAEIFDGDLEMFRERPKPVNLAALRFLRWLAEQGRLEHPTAGRASGPLAAALMPQPGPTETIADWFSGP